MSCLLIALLEADMSFRVLESCTGAGVLRRVSQLCEGSIISIFNFFFSISIPSF